MSSTLTQPRISQPDQKAVALKADWTPRLVGFGAAVVSVLAYIYFAKQGVVLSYKDAISHLQITARVVTTSPQDAPAQLGGVWLPLQHMLMLPLSWIDSLYYSGFVGSLVSMVSYVIASVYIYKIVFGLTAMRVPALAGVVIFAFNPNVLYMQATPMSELLLFATIAALVYHTQQWIQTEKSSHLFLAALAATLGCLTRYEAWVLTLVFGIIVTIVAYRRHGLKRADGTFFGFTFLAASSALGWGIWNLVIFGNALNFQTGEYSKPALWVGQDEPSLGNWMIAAKTYTYAVLGNLGIFVIILAVVGLIALILRRNVDVLPTLGLLVMVPFFVFALEQGQRPLHVAQINGDLYNVRFGLLMIIPAAIAAGYIASLFKARLWNLAVLAASVAATVAIIVPSGVDSIITVREPVAYIEKGSNAPLTPTSDYLRQNYDRGTILMESFGNETILFDARISLGNNIYEGSYQKWEPALNDPASSDIQWIIMREGTTPDKVFQELQGSEKLDSYDLVYSNDTYFVYERKS